MMASPVALRLVILPLPPPGVPADIDMVNGPFRNSADTARLAFIRTLQLTVVPVHEPVQDPNASGLVALAVSLMVVPALNRNEHVPVFDPAVIVQLMPAGLDVTFPLPVPRPETVRR